MKISVSSYSFSQWVKGTDRTHFDCILKAAELGFDGIEFANCGELEISDKAYAEEIKKECDKYGLEITALVFHANFISGCNGEIDAEIERVKKIVDVAEVLGVKTIRHDAALEAGKYETFENALPIIARGCREVTEYAQKKGIATMVENHGTFVQESKRMEKLFNAVDHPNFSLLVDIGNFMCVDEECLSAVNRLASMAGYAHVKDFYFKSANDGEIEDYFATESGNYLKSCILGYGVVPVLDCLKSLKNAGFDGCVSIEYDGSDETIEALKECKTTLEKYIALI